MIGSLCRALLALFLLSGVTAECAAAEVGGNVTHVVLVWLKQPDDPDALERFVRASKRMAMLPGVLYHRVGPVLPSEREVVDSDFDVGVSVTLKDREALKGYLEHPVHRQTIHDIMRPLVEKFVVYDFVAR